MTINERAGLTDSAWVRKIDELKQDLEDNYSAISGSYTEVAEWMLSADCEAAFDLDDADFLRRWATRQDATK